MIKTLVGWAAVTALATLLGCSNDDGGDESPGNLSSQRPELDARTPWADIPKQCRGIDVRGLEYSPGGDVLPNRCAPFDGTYNNPYAIRCVDADPEYATQWLGDEFCILPPPPELGTQVYVGPKSYDDPDDYEAYLLEPGEEINTLYFVNSENDEPRFYYRTNWRMRDGSHHMIVQLLNGDREDGWATDGASRSEVGLAGGGFGGSQRTDIDRPQGTLQVPDENIGLGGRLAANQQFAFNLHHMNRFEEPILREAWTNVWYVEDDEVTRPMESFGLIGNPADVAVPDGEHRLLHYRSEVVGNPRIISMFGHRHANTDRFGIWIEREDGETINAYESFEYTDMPLYQYDSVSLNPEPDVEARVDGGHSGLLELSEGDVLHFVCDINNRSGVTLRFVNELITGEMCIVFGSVTGEGSFSYPQRVSDEE
jgi:hypothetical protein